MSDTFLQLVKKIEEGGGSRAAWDLKRLERVNGPLSVKPLLPLLKNSDADIRRIALEMINAFEYGGNAFDDVLTFFAEESDSWVMLEAIEFFISEKNKKASTTLIPLISEAENPRVRERALYFFQVVDDPLSYDAIMKATYDEHEDVANKAVEVLSKRRLKHTVPRLIEIAEGENKRLSRSASYALERINDATICPSYLEKVYSTSDTKLAIRYISIADFCGCTLDKQYLEELYYRSDKSQTVFNLLRERGSKIYFDGIMPKGLFENVDRIGGRNQELSHALEYHYRFFHYRLGNLKKDLPDEKLSKIADLMTEEIVYKGIFDLIEIKNISLIEPFGDYYLVMTSHKEEEHLSGYGYNFIFDKNFEKLIFSGNWIE